MAFSGDWTNWQTSDLVTVLQPELDYEGARLSLQPSRHGPVNGPVRQLRAQATYQEGAKIYLLYSVAGESGIAIAELIDEN